jgi:hypothetical protein
MPAPLRVFIDGYVSNGAHIPIKALVAFEKSRVEWNQHGAICRQDRDKQHMLVCCLFVTKHLVNILMRPKENSLPVRSAKTAQNLVILASLLQLLVLTLFARTGRSAEDAVIDETEILNRKKGKPLGLRNDDGVSQDLYCLAEFEGMAEVLHPFMEEMRESMRVWAEKLLSLCSKARLR